MKHVSTNQQQEYNHGQYTPTCKATLKKNSSCLTKKKRHIFKHNYENNFFILQNRHIKLRS